MVTKEEILDNFQYLNVKPDDQVLNKCLEICLKYNIDAEDFVDQWSAYTVTNLHGAPPTVDNLEKMERKEFEQNKDKNFPKKAVATPKHTSDDFNSDDTAAESDYNKPESNVTRTPKSTRISLSKIQTPVQNVAMQNSSMDTTASPSSHVIEYSQRTNALSVQCFYGESTATFKREASVDPIIIKDMNGEHSLKADALYMYEVMGKKAQTINSMADWLGRTIMKKHHLCLHEGLLKNSGMRDVATYGRIISDSCGKINDQSIFLEGTFETNMGFTANLNVSKLAKYSLFPGQVVAVKGNHTKAGTFVVDEIFTDADIDFFPEPPVTTDKLQIVVACGPFTTQNNISYEPLNDLLNYVVEYKPHILLLLGPFLVEENESIYNGSLLESFDAFFEHVIETIMNTLKNIDVQVIIVSSERDVHHHPVYPTLPYAVREKYNNLTFMADPCMVNINGLVIGATTADVLFHISTFEIHHDKNSETKYDRLGRLASHILTQHSFYPLDPPNKEVHMDHSLFEYHGVLDVKPHILILPSKLRRFIKNIDDCLVINPERLTKGFSGGTFARIEVSPGSSNSVCSRVACHILNI